MNNLYEHLKSEEENQNYLGTQHIEICTVRATEGIYFYKNNKLLVKASTFYLAFSATSKVYCNHIVSMSVCTEMSKYRQIDAKKCVEDTQFHLSSQSNIGLVKYRVATWWR